MVSRSLCFFSLIVFFFFFQAEDGIRDHCVTGVQTCALPISTDVQHPASRLMTRDKLMLDTDGPVADPLVKPVLCTGGRVRMGDIVLRCIVGRHRCGTWPWIRDAKPASGANGEVEPLLGYRLIQHRKEGPQLPFGAGGTRGYCFGLFHVEQEDLTTEVDHQDT